MRQQRAGAAAVDDESRLMALARRGLDEGAVPVGEIDARDRGLLVDFDAVLARVIEKQLIETRSLHLERALVRRLERLSETEYRARRTVGRDESGPVLRK